MTLDQMKSLPKGQQESLIERVTGIRKKAKVVVYSAVYGVGKVKLAREIGVSVKDAERLLEAYWKRNWAVKKVAKDSHVKTLSDGSMWLYNPVSGYYYPLRYEKDKWSTLNQGTGVYVFDLWVMFMRKAGVKISAQIHDEILLACPNKDLDNTKEVLYNSMKKVNEALGLNVTIGIDAKVGQSYAEVH